MKFYNNFVATLTVIMREPFRYLKLRFINVAPVTDCTVVQAPTLAGLSSCGQDNVILTYFCLIHNTHQYARNPFRKGYPEPRPNVTLRLVSLTSQVVLSSQNQHRLVLVREGRCNSNNYFCYTTLTNMRETPSDTSSIASI